MTGTTIDNETFPTSNCFGDGPPQKESCAPCAFCDGQDCSGNGSCTKGRCECKDGFTGATCSIESSICATGVQGVTAAGDAYECCADGLVDADGACCDGVSGGTPELDAKGKCCPSGHVDGCGICNPEGFENDAWGQGLDSRGVCCPVCSKWLLL